MGLFDSLGRANYLPIGDVARLIVQAEHIIDELVCVAQLDDELSNEKYIIKEIDASRRGRINSYSSVSTRRFVHSQGAPFGGIHGPHR